MGRVYLSGGSYSWSTKVQVMVPFVELHFKKAMSWGMMDKAFSRERERIFINISLSLDFS